VTVGILIVFYSAPLTALAEVFRTRSSATLYLPFAAMNLVRVGVRRSYVCVCACCGCKGDVIPRGCACVASEWPERAAERPTVGAAAMQNHHQANGLLWTGYGAAIPDAFIWGPNLVSVEGGLMLITC
jgi:hypothetical protein